MGAKEYSIAFAIAGTLAGNFSKTFKTANDAVQGFNQKINDLNKQAGSVGNVLKLRQEVSDAARATIDAKKKFNGLSRQYEASSARVTELSNAHAAAKRRVYAMERAAAKSGTTTQAMSQKYDAAVAEVAKLGKELENAKINTKDLGKMLGQAKVAVDKSKQSLDKKRESLKKTESASGTLGQKTADLVKRQDELTKSANRARGAQEKLAKINERVQSASTLQDNIKGSAFSSLSTLNYMASAATGTFAAPVMQAMSFEDQQAELRKFSDDYKEVFDGIKDLSLKYAKSTEDMTAMAANAYQSGIAKSKDEALKLVEIQNQMAIAFDMTGEQVGASFADIQSKMGLTIEQSEALFDIVNQIGNTTSASAKDVVEVLARSGGALRGLTAMSEKQIAALAGSFRSASTSSEVASTSMMTFVNAMTSGAGATKAQSEAFEKLGIDTVKLSKMMTKSPEYAQRAIQDVFARINKLPEAEKAALIGKIFGNEAGVKSAVATLAKQGDLLAGNFDLISDPVKYAGSMLKEYQARADTTSNSLEIMKNAMKLVTGGIGMALLPSVRNLAETFVENSKGVIVWINNNQDLISTLLHVGGVAAGLAAGFHVLRMVTCFLISPLVSVYKAYLNFQKALELANLAMAAGEKLTLAQRVVLLANAAATKVATVAKKAWAMALDGSLLALIKEKSALWANKIAVHAQTAAVKIATLAQKAWAVALVVGPLIAQKAVLLAHKAATLAHVVAIKGAAIAQKAWAAALFFGPLVAQKVAVLAHEAATLSHVVAINGAAIAQKAWMATLAIGPLVAQKASLIALQGAMLAWKGVCTVVTVAQKALNFVLMANPIGLVVTAIAGLVAGGVALYQNWESIKQKVKELWEWVSNFFGKIGETIAGTWEKVKSIFGFGGKETTVNVAAAQSAGALGVSTQDMSRVAAQMSSPAAMSAQDAIKVVAAQSVAQTASQTPQPVAKGAAQSAKTAANVVSAQSAPQPADPVANTPPGKLEAHDEKYRRQMIDLTYKLEKFVQGTIYAEEAKEARLKTATIAQVERAYQSAVTLKDQTIAAAKARLQTTGQAGAVAAQPVVGLASGGLATAPTMAMIGEGRESEAVLPLSKLDGMLGRASATSNSVSVNLTVNVSGASQDAYAEVKRGIAEGSASLKRELERLLNDQRRLSYV